MAANSKRKIETRQTDKFGITVVIAAIALVACAALLFVNYNRPPLITDSKTTVKAAIPAPANESQAPNIPTVNGRAFSVGTGSTNSNSTSRTENGDGS